MSISEKVAKSVSRMLPGRVFGYQDISEYQQAPLAVSKALSRLVKSNKINRIEKGRFYRPKRGILGDLNPSDQELLKTLVFKDGRLKGYVTGVALYNQLGLTTQLPRTIKVAIEGARQVKDFGSFRAKLVKSRAPVIESDVILLQYLDVLRDIKEIPDSDVNESLMRMKEKFAELDEKQIKRIKKLATTYYRAQERALVGLLLERVKDSKDRQLQATLNPLTTYKVGLDNQRWPEKENWNIQ